MKEDIDVKVLIVDDKPENLMALEVLLESPNITLTKCLSGEEALKSVLKDDYAVILLDVQMPDMDGYETAKLIKSLDKSKDIPIIFVTAINKEPEHVISGYSVGGIDYIFKPFDSDILKSKVAQLIKIFLNSKKIKLQAEMLHEKTQQLEIVNQELFRISCELRKSEALQRLVGETSTDTIVILNVDHEIISINPTVESMFGYSMDEVLGRNAELLIPLHLLEINKDTQLLNVEKTEIMAICKNGSHFSAEVQMKKCILEGNYTYVCTIRDITERVKQMVVLQHMAMHDDLTNLPNRKKLYEMVNNLAQDEQREFSLILMDLDNFKAINDTLGHHIGDLLLIKIGMLIKECLPANETMFRLGGDEFAVLVPDCNLTKAISTAQTILARIDQPIAIQEEGFLSIRASLGIVSFPEHGKDIQTLLRRADVAMYTAKRNGSGYANYSMEQDQNDPYRLLLMSELRAAIDNQELFLVYQSKWDLKTNKISSVEGLLRWNHPQLGIIPPSDFIPIAEQMGIIGAITDWVLTEAVKQSKRWEEEDLHIAIAVNLSVRNLQDGQLPARLKALLQQYGVSQDKIMLEITESFIMADPIRAKDILMQIHNMGIQLAIDDFGTGYSSLAYLKSLPVDTLKIDKSFIVDMAHNEIDLMIVQSIIFLAHNLGLNVVAEGVEDQESWDLLTSCNCDISQGYFLQKPLAADEFKSWLLNKNKTIESGNPLEN